MAAEALPHDPGQRVRNDIAVMADFFKGLERIEEARERLTGASFMTGLFLGRPDFELLRLPEESEAEQAEWETFSRTLEDFLRRRVDPDEIERNAKIPQDVLQGLLDLGAFGMKIPTAFGGLGFSFTNYGRALTLIASWSNILALTVAVPQSIGIAMPILLFGNETQKRTYLPRAAREAISAFALTEPITGSDAANIRTQAVLDSTESSYLVNGDKLWCTNGSIARYITLIARVPARKVVLDGATTWVPVPEGKEAEASVHTAFIVDMTTPGIRVRQRCQFEGCRGIENAYITLENVRVPAENVIGEVGKGLKYALTILNVGRAISIPAICLGMAKQAWQPTLDHAHSRTTFGQPLATRQTQVMRAGAMAANLFAMEAVASLVWRMAERHRYDVRIEAAMAKIFCSERAIDFLRNAQILFGGAGYETAESKRLRGEPAFGIEQLVRDAEMYRIGEGATDILRPFVAREGLNPHLERSAKYLDPRTSPDERAKELTNLFRYYLPWYREQWKRKPLPDFVGRCHPITRTILTFVERASRRLARAILYAMAFRRLALRDDQGRQNRIEQIGEDLLVMAAAAFHAEAHRLDPHCAARWELVQEIFRQAKMRVNRLIPELIHNDDTALTDIGHHAFRGAYPFLTRGIIQRGLDDYRPEARTRPQP